MGRPPKNPEITEKEEPKEITPESILATYLTKNKEDHYNFDSFIDYVVSSGSLLLDIAMGGGIRAGVHRMTGVSTGGKTSCTLSFCNNFLKEKSIRRRGVYIKSEGRLGKEVIERSGITFVTNAEEWKDGTCFVYKCSVYESAIDLLRMFVKNNPDNIQYFFILDSMDALVPKGDMDKSAMEANKVSGGALLGSDFLRKMSNAMSSKGHICVMISQVRAVVTINAYQKVDPKLTNASGGNALSHYPDWIMEFQPRTQKNIIWAGVEGDSDRLGHFCKINIKKSTNEKDGVKLEYPIKYGRVGGNSVWVEYEIADLLIAFEFAKANRAWVTIEDALIKELADNNIPLEKQHNGMEKFRKYLEANPKITEFLYAKFKKTLSS